MQSSPIPPCNNVAVHFSPMDEPSIQLQLDLGRALQTELRTRRPLLHRLQGSSWVLQIPRPANAVRHGSRLYYNILVDPCFVKQSGTAKHGWFSQSLPPAEHIQTTTALEELLRDLETLARSIGPESEQKSNGLVEDRMEKLETLVDAVAVTSLDDTFEDAYRQVHRDVPVLASPEDILKIAALDHFRTLSQINNFGEDGCNDWRSTTVVSGLPEWAGLSILLDESNDIDPHHTLIVAFNNQRHNSSAILDRPGLSIGSWQKRHAARTKEDEDFAEAVFFTKQGLSRDNVALISCADPAIHSLAEVYTGSNKVGPQSQTAAAIPHDSEAKHTTSPVYHISRRDIPVGEGRERGFLAWLIAKAQLGAPMHQMSQQNAITSVDSNLESDTDPQKVTLGAGESRVLV